MFYKASLDKMAITVSSLIGLLFLFIILFTSGTFGIDKNNSADNHTILYVSMSGIFLSLVFIITWLLHPSGYEITQDALLIKRPANSITISKQEIQSVRLLPKSETLRTTRTFGSGGLFGYFGKFYNSKIGKMTWYVTNKNNMVLLKMQNGKIYIVSPDDTNTFIKEFGKPGN